MSWPASSCYDMNIYFLISVHTDWRYTIFSGTLEHVQLIWVGYPKDQASISKNKS